MAIRAAASGMGREAGIAAMVAEANHLCEGNSTTEGGGVKEQQGSYRTVLR